MKFLAGSITTGNLPKVLILCCWCAHHSALKRKVGGTAKDYFKEWVGEFTRDGLVGAKVSMR